ncbi:MAG: hypothetical protein O3A18_09450 [Planctomycetota bacterium]|nr:hypothetical protein [Planctomycetota bacterium]
MTTSASPPDGMLIVTVDRLPAWLLPLAGCTWVATPALDALAGRGLVFDRVIAASDAVGDTLAALGGCGSGDRSDSWPLLAAATAAGWSPVVVTDDAGLAATLPPEAAIEQVPLMFPPRLATTATETAFGRLFAVAVRSLEAGRHRFVWCHSSSLATSWDAPRSFREAYLDPDDPPPPEGATPPDLPVDTDTDPDLVMGLRQVFAGQLTLLDSCLATLLEAVAERSAQSPWTLVFAGVRGLPLGLHGRIGCGPLPPYAELIQLPAVLVDHRGRMAAQRYGGLTTPADLGQTLLDLIGDRGGGSPPAAVAADPRIGRSLLGLLDAWQGPNRDRAITMASQGVSVSTRGWHLVCPEGDGTSDRPHLYARPDDYFDACDVADRSVEVAEELAAIAELARTDLDAAWHKPLSAAAASGGSEAIG